MRPVGPQKDPDAAGGQLIDFGVVELDGPVPGAVVDASGDQQVRAEFNGLLECRDGLVSQLYVTTRMLLRIEHGEYPDLAVPLHRNAEQVLRRLSGHR
ncbi:MAG: hypothetical protein ACRDRO_16560 [Pseudonocardiaceae bacterium]